MNHPNLYPNHDEERRHLEGSQWVIDKILNHYINVASCIPLRGNSYLPLPVELRNSKKLLINIKNEDDKCFLWCHIRHLKPENTHPERIKMTDKAFEKELDYSDVSFPVQIKDVKKNRKAKFNQYKYFWL